MALSGFSFVIALKLHTQTQLSFKISLFTNSVLITVFLYLNSSCEAQPIIVIYHYCLNICISLIVFCFTCVCSLESVCVCTRLIFIHFIDDIYIY